VVPKAVESCPNAQKTQQVLQSALEKNFLVAGCGFFRSSGPGPKLLDGSISLKFLLETRLQSESFDTLDDLLGFRVQKL